MLEISISTTLLPTASYSPNFDCSQVQPVDPSKQRFSTMMYGERKALERRTGAAKTSVPKKKKAINEKRCIVVILGKVRSSVAFIQRPGGNSEPFGIQKRRSPAP